MMKCIRLLIGGGGEFDHEWLVKGEDQFCGWPSGGGMFDWPPGDTSPGPKGDGSPVGEGEGEGYGDITHPIPGPPDFNDTNLPQHAYADPTPGLGGDGLGADGDGWGKEYDLGGDGLV